VNQAENAATTVSPVISTRTAWPTNTLVSTITPRCIDQVSGGDPPDVTIPDETHAYPGQPFTKTWRMKNVGTCTWTEAYGFALFSGEEMGVADSVRLPKTVAPGEKMEPLHPVSIKRFYILLIISIPRPPAATKRRNCAVNANVAR